MAGGLPPPPPGLDLTEDRSTVIVASTVATWILAVVTVALRVLSRRFKGNRLWIDDWLIIVSLIWAGAHTFAVAGYMVHNGLGKHVWAAPPNATRAWALGLFIAEITYTLGLVFVKWSILAFYWRIFNARPSIRIPIWIMFFIVCSWGTAVMLITIFQCIPTRAFWERHHPVHPMSPSEFHCGVDDHKFFYGNAVPNICTDGLLIMLPIPYIFALSLPRAQRFAIGSIFLIGALVTVISIVRFTYILRANLLSPDITWNFVDLSFWSIVEENLSIVCACLPSLKPIMNFVVSGTFNSADPPSGPVQPSVITIGRQSAKQHKHWATETDYGLATLTSANRPDDSDMHPFAMLNDHASERSVNTRKDPMADAMELRGLQAEPRSPLDKTAGVGSSRQHEC